MWWFFKLLDSWRLEGKPKPDIPSNNEQLLDQVEEQPKHEEEISEPNESPSDIVASNMPQPISTRDQHDAASQAQEAQVKELLEHENVDPESMATSSEPEITRFTAPSSPAPPCNFTRIPLEILYCITDLLPPANLLILSHTCRDLHHNLLRMLQRSRTTITYIEIREYLALFCKSNVEQYVCLVCMTIHGLDSLNLPSQQRRFCNAQTSLNAVYNSSLLGPFQLDHGHVQLACKLSQVPEDTLTTQQKAFLDGTLSRFTLTSGTYSPRERTIGNGTAFCTQAKVRGDVLVLKRMWKASFLGVDHEYDVGKLFGDLQLCPHLNTLTDNGEAIYAGQVAWFSGALQPVLQHVPSMYAAKCLGCSTDVAVYSHEDGYVCIITWQVLGGAGSESFPTWEEHLWRHANRLPVISRLWNLRAGPRFPYSMMLWENELPEGMPL